MPNYKKLLAGLFIAVLGYVAAQPSLILQGVAEIGEATVEMVNHTEVREEEVNELP